MDEESVTILEEGIEDIPQEVKDFLFGEEYEEVAKQLASLVNSDKEKIDLPNEVLLYALGGRTENELLSYISELNIDTEKKMQVKKLITEKVVDEILLTIEANKEIEAEAERPIANSTLSSGPVTKLTTISDRLRQSSISTPTTRNYTLQKGIVPDNLPITEPGVTAPADTTQIPTAPVSLHSNAVPVSIQEEPIVPPSIVHTIDPYHEQIEK